MEDTPTATYTKKELQRERRAAAVHMYSSGASASEMGKKDWWTRMGECGRENIKRLS